MPVYAVVRPSRVLEFRRVRGFYRLERPEPPSGLKIHLLVLRRGLGVGARVGCAHGYPFFEIRNLFGCQFFLRRHLQIRVTMPNGLDQPAFAHAPGNDRRAAVAALLPAAFPIQPQAGLYLLILAVALVTFADQHRPNLFFKKLQARRIRGSSHAGTQE